MTQKSAPTANSRRKIILGGAVVATVCAAAVLYGNLSDKGTGAISPDCLPAKAIVEKLAPFARGEVAVLAPTKTPKLVADISFEGPDGRRMSLADFRGKTVLLNLWATWCVPCRVEMPALDNLQKKLGGPNFEVVAINIDTARLERRQSFLKEAGVTALAFYADPKADVFQVLKRAGKVVGLPTTILIDSRGCELGVAPGAAEWASEDAIRLISAALGT